MKNRTRREFLRTTAIGATVISASSAFPGEAVSQEKTPVAPTTRGRIASSRGELERRWNAAREIMKRERIDYLVIRNDEAWQGAPIKWFTDTNATSNNPITAIFPVDDEMTTISQGAPGESLKGSPGVPPGVKKRLTMNYMVSAPYTRPYDADLAIGVLKEKKGAVIGLVGKEFIPISFYELLVKGLPGAKFVDATSQINALMAIKSPEELESIRAVAAIQDQALEHVRKTIRPGMKEYELFAAVQHACSLQGSYRFVILIGSGPQGGPGASTLLTTTAHSSASQAPPNQNRTLQGGDQISLLIETNGPSGHWTELARPISLGKPSQQLQDAYGVALEAQQITLKLLKPGASPKDAWDANNDFLKKKGFLPETRLYAHGQGYHFVEQPLIRNDEPMKIQAGMNLTIHPSAANGKICAGITDNYIITESGPGPCIHKTPKGIVVV